MALPQSTRGTRAFCCHPLLMNPIEKWVTVSLSVAFISPPHSQCLLMDDFSNSIAILLPALMALPQSTRGIRACCCHPLLMNPIEKWVTVSLSFVFIFFPPISNVCSWMIFPIELPFCCWHLWPSISLQGEQEPAAAIPMLKNPIEKWATVSLSVVFIFFPPIPNVVLIGDFSN